MMSLYTLLIGFTVLIERAALAIRPARLARIVNERRE